MKTQPQLLGVEITGLPPIEDCFIELQSGLTVLYGKNGVGKSRILQGLVEALSVERVTSGVRRLFFRRDPFVSDLRLDRLVESFPDEPWLRIGHTVGLRRDPTEWIASDALELIDEIANPVVQSLAIRLIDAQFEKTSLHANGDDVDALIEIANNRHFVVVTSVSGRKAAVVASASEDTPQLRRLWSDAVSRFRALLESEDGATFARELKGWHLQQAFPNLHDYRGDSLIQEDMRSAMSSVLGISTPFWAGDSFLEIDGPWPTWTDSILFEDRNADLEAEALTAIGRHRTPENPLGETELVPGLGVRIGLRHLVADAKKSDVFDGDSNAVSEEFQHHLRALNEQTTSTYRKLLPGAPALRLVIRDRRRWVSSGMFEWNWEDFGTSGPLDQLSAAQRRWANFAIRFSCRVHAGSVPQVVVLDEPEQALHRSAERFLAVALNDLAHEFDACFVVASHSPSFILSNTAKIIHVQRNTIGNTSLSEIEKLSDLSEQVLGLDAVDLLQFCRCVLLVEGQHDKLVLERLFERELALSGVKVFPVRGARNLSAEGAQFLFKYSDATVVVLVDNEDAERVAGIWRRAVENPTAALEILGELKLGGSNKSESRFLYEFCNSVVQASTTERVQLFSLTAADIIEYLPTGAFAKKLQMKSWPELRKEHIETKSPKDFKGWLTAEYAASFDESAILKGCESLDQIPSDFTNLIDRLRGRVEW